MNMLSDSVIVCSWVRRTIEMATSKSSYETSSSLFFGRW